MHFTLVHGIGRLVHTVAGKIKTCTKTFVPGICRLVVGFSPSGVFERVRSITG